MVTISTLHACIRGDSRAHRAFYEATAPYVYTVVSRYITDLDFRKDTMQEAYALLFRKLEQYRPERGPLKPWLRRVVVNTCLQQLRRTAALPYFDGERSLELLSQQPTILDDLSHADLMAQLDNMPERYRIVFMLSVVEGYNHQEIADQLAIRPETSRSQLTRAKQWLRQRLLKHPNLPAYGLA